jgi:hypothetical protein
MAKRKLIYPDFTNAQLSRKAALTRLSQHRQQLLANSHLLLGLTMHHRPVQAQAIQLTAETQPSAPFLQCTAKWKTLTNEVQ